MVYVTIDETRGRRVRSKNES